MRAREHRLCRILEREPLKRGARSLESRQQHFLECAAEHHAVGNRVHILRREAEVYPLAHFFERRSEELVLDEIFDGLDVMIRRWPTSQTLALDFLHDARVVEREIARDAPKCILLFFGELAEAHISFGEGDEVFAFYVYAVLDECVLAYVRHERLRSGAVPAVDTRERRELVIRQCAWFLHLG